MLQTQAIIQGSEQKLSIKQSLKQFLKVLIYSKIRPNLHVNQTVLLHIVLLSYPNMEDQFKWAVIFNGMVELSILECFQNYVHLLCFNLSSNELYLSSLVHKPQFTYILPLCHWKQTNMFLFIRTVIFLFEPRLILIPTL